MEVLLISLSRTDRESDSSISKETGDTLPKEICPDIINRKWGLQETDTRYAKGDLPQKFGSKLATRTTFWYCQVGDLPETG